MMTDSHFSTSDISLATTLIALGYPLHGIDRGNPQKTLFLIENKEGIEGAIRDYFAYRLTVEPNRYFSVLRNLKSRIRMTGTHKIGHTKL